MKWRVSEGHRPDRLRTDELEGEDRLRQQAGADPEQRLRDMDRDGIDAEVIFPNKGLVDVGHARRRLRHGPVPRLQRVGVGDLRAATTTACRRRPRIATGDLEGSIAEVQRVAKLGFRALTLPCKPVWGAHDVDHPNYNLPDVRPAVGGDPGRGPADHLPRLDRARSARRARQRRRRHQLRLALAVADHRAGRQPLRLRRARALPAACASPPSRPASAGWRGCSTPWTRPTASTTSGCGRSSAKLPSEYFREHGFASFQEDPAGLALAEPMGLADNFMWGNDYPHHEGTWPHSAEAIERTMGHLSDAARAKVLGLNAARLFGFEVRG